VAVEILSHLLPDDRVSNRTPIATAMDELQASAPMRGHLDSRSRIGFTSHVGFYGLLDRDLVEVIEFYPSREAAEKEFAEILADEPGWSTKLEVVQVDLGGGKIPVHGVSRTPS
jgi:hypothetical protein